MLALAGGQRTVPVLVEDGKVVQIGWQGRGCVVECIGTDNDAAPAIHSRPRRGAGRRLSPFVFRLAQANTLAGWVLNGEEGVEIHLEGAEPALDAFLRDSKRQPPPAARITAIDVQRCRAGRVQRLHDSRQPSARTAHVRISPDLPVCDDCLAELFDPADRRYRYPYINCTNCGPRYTDRAACPTTGRTPRCGTGRWTTFCAAQYHDPADRRFHAQPVACPACGPDYFCERRRDRAGDASIAKAAELLRAGGIVAVKGIGGYHLACDARMPPRSEALRERKYRKEKPFAVMVRQPATSRAGWSRLHAEAEALLTSTARPIVLAPAKARLPGVAPDNGELGVMLPYAPLHHLLFAAGAPEVLVMTSANRSSEPIAYQDDDALQRLAGIADAFLIGERPIARRVDDSVARAGVFGPVILRRARGYAPGAVARLPIERPILAVGADLKNTDHARRGRTGVRQPAHRRPGSLRVAAGLSTKPSTI